MTGPLMPGSILSMPAAAAERLIRLDSGDAALLYLYLLGHGNAAGLNWPRERLQGALDLLSAQGMAGAVHGGHLSFVTVHGVCPMIARRGRERGRKAALSNKILEKREKRKGAGLPGGLAGF